VQRIGLENEAVRPDGPEKLDHEEAADQADDDAEATGLVSLARGKAALAWSGDGGMSVIVSMSVIVIVTCASRRPHRST
jgi:hypothetical protein